MWMVKFSHYIIVMQPEKGIHWWAYMPSRLLRLPQQWKKKCYFCPSGLSQNGALKVSVLANIYCFTWFINV